MLHRQLLTILFVAICLITACSDNAGESATAPDSTNVSQPDSFSASAEEPAPDSITAGTDDADDLVLSYSPQQILQIKSRYRFTGDSTNPAAIDSFYTAIAKKMFLEKLKSLDPGVEIYSATSVCLFARTRAGFQTAINKSNIKSIQGVNSIRHNYRFKVNLPATGSSASAEATADETWWGVKRICNASRPNGTYNPAWVLDTGVDPSHSDLNVDMVYSKSFVPGEAVNDVLGHGTHVSGIIGAKANGVGILGVAPNAPIRALKVIDETDHINYRDYIKALEYVATNGKRGSVMNLSFVRGFGAADDVNLINQIAANGVYVTIAAGNASNIPGNMAVNIDTYTNGGKTGVYPACINGPRIYTATAFGEPSSDANFANYGPSVDFTMPGIVINSTLPGSQYGKKNGTSMAAPHLAGLLLLTSGVLKDAGQVVCSHDNNLYKIAHE
jgi:hypothetical protein